MHCPGTDGCDYRVIRPEFAVDWRQTVWFFAVLSAHSLLIAVVFASLGYWPILPFAGLELSALGIALYVSARRSQDCQVVRVDGDKLHIEKGRRRPEQRWTFGHAWTEVTLAADRRRWHPCRVVIRSAGDSVEVGEFLDEAARKRLGAELQDWIGPMGRAIHPAPVASGPGRHQLLE